MSLLLARIATINALTASLPRILYGMALDDVLPKAFTYLYPHFKTPLLRTAVTAAISCLHAWWLGGDDERIIHLVLVAVCAWDTVYLLVTLSVVLLCIRRPSPPRAYRSPLFPLPQLLPSIGILLGMFHITPPGMNPADIYLLFALMLGLATAYASFWTLCVQQVGPFRPSTVEEVLGKEPVEEDQQQREKAHVHLDALV